MIMTGWPIDCKFLQKQSVVDSLDELPGDFALPIDKLLVETCLVCNHQTPYNEPDFFQVRIGVSPREGRSPHATGTVPLSNSPSAPHRPLKERDPAMTALRRRKNPTSKSARRMPEELATDDTSSPSSMERPMKKDKLTLPTVSACQAASVCGTAH
jgi:hypothetical protein